jgi:hypothetical protein
MRLLQQTAQQAVAPAPINSTKNIDNSDPLQRHMQLESLPQSQAW